MKKSDSTIGLFATVLLLLVPTKISMSAVMLDRQQAIATVQSDSQLLAAVPSNQEAPNKSLWLWLLLVIPVGGLFWWLVDRISATNRLEPMTSAGLAPLAMTTTPPEPRTPPVSAGANELESIDDRDPPPDRLFIDLDTTKTISLLEERLAIALTKRKVGEIVVRKEIETRMISIPVRRETLIIEQVEPEYKQIAVIDLAQPEPDLTPDLTLPTVAAKFTTTAAAIEFLQSLTDRSSAGLQNVQLNLVLTDATAHAAAHKWLDRESTHLSRSSVDL